MAHVSYLARDEAAESVRPVFDAIEKAHGAVPNFHRALAHSPELLRGFLAFYGGLQKAELDPKLRELAYLRVSHLNGCAYCLAHHREAGRKAGLIDAQVEGIADPGRSEAYDHLQQLVLLYAEQVTRHIHADAAVIADLRRALGDRGLVELAVTVGMANLTNRVTETLGMELP